MPVYSEIRLKFLNDWVLNDTLIINIGSSLNNGLNTWKWVGTRSSGFEVTTGTPTLNPGETSALNFASALQIDFLTDYVVTVENTNEVLIQSETLGEDFIRTITGVLNTGTIQQTINNHLLTLTENKEIYSIEYCDDFNTARRISIQKSGHTSGSTELLADVNPLTISYESSEDFKFSPIRPSTAEVFMIFDSEGSIDFEEFWTADEKEFKIQDIKDGKVEWSGYVIPSGFEYELKGGKYYASIRASDGLGTLESLTFVDDNQKPYGNQDLVYNNGFEFPFSLIITEILKKIELDLDLWTCVDSYERTMLKTGDVRDADPLSASFVNVKTYIKSNEDEKIPYWYGSGEEWNCKEVLENILYIFGAKLYQEFGVWRVKSINVDIDYGTGATQRYWRKYNTVGTYLFNYEVANDEINIPCNSESKIMIGNDHVISMDDVYKAFRMNYEYTFLRDGDSAIDYFKNTSFCDFDNNSILAAPNGWTRWRNEDKWYIRIKDITVPFADAGGNTCGIEIGTHKAGIPVNQGSIRTDPNPATWTSLKNSELTFVKKGSKTKFNMWCKYRAVSPDNTVGYYPVFRFILYTETKRYYLRNSVVNNTRSFSWQEADDKVVDVGSFYDFVIIDDVFFYLGYYHSKNSTSSNVQSNIWREFDLDFDEIPEDGYLEFHIHGLAADRGRLSENFPSFISYQNGTTKNDWLRVVRENWVDQGGDIPRLQITGFKIGYIPDGSELPQQQDYIYNNQNKNYTLQVDPITIYNGDVQDNTHVSNIIVPTNINGDKNFWDDLSSSYGSSSLGLLTVRQIMRQYQKPYRILEGNVKVQDARFGSVYTFEILPNIRFILQRGSFNKQKQYIENATFVQISNDVLPNGGFEGGNTLSPEWIRTGNTYCQIGNDALNTGYVIIEEQDINPNSETYQDTREVVSVSQDLAQCPLSTPRLYYWGSDDVYLNTETLKFSPFTEINNKEIQVSMDNTEGNYLYFVHLKSLGVVEKITTLTSPNNVLSDWVYLLDVVIDGYIYRVLRTDYVMTQFNGFTHNFKFN